MRWIRHAGLVLILGTVGTVGTVGVQADGDGEAPEAQRTEIRAQVTSDFLGLLRARLESALARAEALREAGRLDEALAVYKEIETVYERDMARLEVILARLGLPAEAAPRPEPVRVVLEGAGATRVQRLTDAEQQAKSLVAVHRALAWLAAHQSATGEWEAAGFGKWCLGQPAAEGPDGQGKPLYDVGVTGLALLAFLRSGHSHVGQDDYAPVVAKGLAYLRGAQDAEGCFGTRTSQHYVYNHGVAALAVVEAYVRSPDERLWGLAQKGLDFIALTRNPYFAWRYGVKPGDNDTSVTGWMVQALAAARLANETAVAKGVKAPFVVDEEAFAGARNWIDKMTHPEFGRVGYIQRGGSPARPMEMIDRFPGERSEAMTAAGIVIRNLCGGDPLGPLTAKGVKLLLRTPPRWDDRGSVDMYYWYYGTLAVRQHGGTAWQVWRDNLVRLLVKAQRDDAEGPCGFDGSWDPLGPWGPDGGRVYSTALNALSLIEVAHHSAK